MDEPIEHEAKLPEANLPEANLPEANLPERTRDDRTERCTASVQMSALLSAITAAWVAAILWKLFG